MKKIVLAIVLLLAGSWWLLPSLEGQGHHRGSAPHPAPHPVPTPHPVPRPAPHPAPRPEPRPAPIFRPQEIRPAPTRVVVHPGVVPGGARLPLERLAPKDVSHYLPGGQIVRRPEGRLAPARANAIHANFQKALARPRVAGDPALRYRPTGQRVRENLRGEQRRWFNQGWWANHLGGANFYGWHYSHYFNRYPYGYWWQPATWLSLCGWYAAPWGPPMFYDYGNNVVYLDNMVYVNDVPVATAPEFAEQAFALADVTAPPPDQQIDFLPLGVYAVASSQDDTNPDHILQLAITKQGLISGTYFNKTNDKATAVEGRIDPVTQRAAIRFLGKDDVVMETGIYNLTQNQTPVLMHFGMQTTQTWYLFRLPDENG